MLRNRIRGARTVDEPPFAQRRAHAAAGVWRMTADTVELDEVPHASRRRLRIVSEWIGDAWRERDIAWVEAGDRHMQDRVRGRGEGRARARRGLDRGNGRLGARRGFGLHRLTDRAYRGLLGERSRAAESKNDRGDQISAHRRFAPVQGLCCGVAGAAASCLGIEKTTSSPPPCV